MRKIFLTGGTGLIGSHIAEYFTDKGIQVICLARPGANTAFLKSLNVELVHGDILNLPGLEMALAGEIESIIHTASKVSDWGKYSSFYDTNVTGTLNILKAAQKNNIKDVIITGSISCFGEEDNKSVKDETAPYNSHYKYFLDSLFPSGMNFYRDTKAEANLKAKEFAGANGINLTILNPAWIYGEREFHSGFYEMIKSVKEGMFILPGSYKNKFHAIYARDLAKIYYLAQQKRLKGINEYLAVSDKAEYHCLLVNLFCKYAGLKEPVRIPKSFIYAPAFLLELFHTLFNSVKAPVISRARVNMFYDNIEYSSRKIREELGFTHDYTFEKGIENSVEWYKKNNYL